MPLQGQDDPYLRDAVQLLATVPGTASEYVRRTYTLTLSDGPIGRLKRGRRPSPSDIEIFIEHCSEKLSNVRISANKRAQKTNLWDFAGVALLLGQFETLRQSATGSPNSFAYEIEIAASVISKLTPRRFSSGTGSHVAAFHLLQDIRRIRILNELIDSGLRIGKLGSTYENHLQAGLGDDFEVQARNLRGRFSTQYDWMFADGVNRRIQESAHDHLNIRTLTTALATYIRALAPAVSEFRQTAHSLDGILWFVAGSRRLLHADDWKVSRSEARVLCAFTSRVSLSHNDLFKGLPGQDVDLWLELLVVTHGAIGKNRGLLPRFESPLDVAPLLSHDGRFLIALIHRLTSDLSHLLDRKMSERYGEVYFRARSQELESASMRALKAVLPAATTMVGGYYWIRDKNESIEVDGVVLWRDVCFILESKSGFLSPATHSGNDSTAISDLRKTIGDGFFQACRLLRALDDKGQLTLFDRTGSALTLDANTIRRAYVLIPMADSIGGITAKPVRLWRNNVIPNGSLPVVMAVQDISLLADALPTGLDLVAYLDYREEVLASEKIFMADEFEILASFVGGADTVGRVALGREQYSAQQMFEDPHYRKHEKWFVKPDMQETYLDPWLLSASPATVSRLPKAPPPSRHDLPERQQIERLLTSTDNLWAASIAMQVDVNVLSALRDLPPIKARAADSLYMSPTQSGVAISANRKLSEVRRRNAEIRRHARHVLYFLDVKDERKLVGAELGRLHVLFTQNRGSIVTRSNVGELDSWFEEFAAFRRLSTRRSHRMDPLHIELLAERGLARSAAIGVSRAARWAEVIDLSECGVDISTAADFWLRTMPKVQLPDHAVPLEQVSSVARDALTLVNHGSIEPDSLARVVELNIQHPNESALAVAIRANLLRNSNDEGIGDVVSSIIEELSIDVEVVATGAGRAKRRTVDIVLGELRRRHPDANMKLAAEQVKNLFSLPS